VGVFFARWQRNRAFALQAVRVSLCLSGVVDLAYRFVRFVEDAVTDNLGRPIPGRA